MKQDERIKFQKDTSKTKLVDSMRHSLAASICAQNRSRAQFFSNVQFGDPVWDLTLSIFTAEHFGESTTISNLSERSGISLSVTARCLEYLLDQEAVLKNNNRYNKDFIPYLLSETTKASIEGWLDNCFFNLQNGLGEAQLNSA